MNLSKFIFTSLFTCFNFFVFAQEKAIKIIVVDQQKKTIENVNIQLFEAASKSLIKAKFTDKNGATTFPEPTPAKYYFRTSAVGFITQEIEIHSPFTSQLLNIILSVANKNLEDISIIGNKEFVQHSQGKTIVTVDASITNVGTSVLEVLEKSPGVMVDRSGNISLQGKSNILVMIDDKQTYLTGAELNNLLSNMSSSQVNQIELIANPSAKYDASGNAGIINIKTKKNKQEGFNGSIAATLGQGKYYKNNNSIILNYRKGKFNAFANYSATLNKSYTTIDADRKYFNDNGTVSSILDQASLFSGQTLGHILKTGVDFYASEKTTIGLTLTANLIKRDGFSEALAKWKSSTGQIDSTIATYTTTDYKLKNGAINLNFKHILNKNQEFLIDLDALKYLTNNKQTFKNELQEAGGYVKESKAIIPSILNIFSAKVDHVIRFGKDQKLESGFKTSSISTDNIAEYENLEGATFSEDLIKSNHFLYKENINALYSSYETKFGKFNAQAGLRYENTYYSGHQLGNSLRPDSAFSKNYSDFFPSGYLSYQADSANTFSLTASRRIDRPAYYKLNPYVFIINKYTYQRGNPYFLPQYSWNIEFSHQFKHLLTTTISYSAIKNYFSQLFLSEGMDILVYTEGNVGQMHNIGASISLQVSPFKWWSMNAYSGFNYKQLSGYQNVNYSSSIKQLLLSLNNQININNGLSAELSGNYTTKARNDLQELIYPVGQLSAGISQSLFKGNGSIKFTARDIFHTQVLKGLTDFPGANEYSVLTRDTQVFSIGFTYRFGKPLKAANRSTGGAYDEIKRSGL